MTSSYSIAARVRSRRCRRRRAPSRARRRRCAPKRAEAEPPGGASSGRRRALPASSAWRDRGGGAPLVRKPPRCARPRPPTSRSFRARRAVGATSRDRRPTPPARRGPPSRASTAIRPARRSTPARSSLGTAPVTLPVARGGSRSVTLVHPGYDDLNYTVQSGDAPVADVAAGQAPSRAAHRPTAPPAHGRGDQAIHEGQEGQAAHRHRRRRNGAPHVPQVTAIDD